MQLNLRFWTTSLHTIAFSLSRKQKTVLLHIIDIYLFSISIYSAFWFRFGFPLPSTRVFQYTLLVLLLILVKIVVFRLIGMYRPVLRYTGFEFISTVVKAVLLSSGTLVFLAYFFDFLQLPRSVLVNDALLTLLFIAGIRVTLRYLAHNLNSIAYSSRLVEKVVIYGAGSAGSQLAQYLAQDPGYRLVAFVDDNSVLHNHVVQGLTVYPPTTLPEILLQKGFDTILLAMPSINGQRKHEILSTLQSLSVQVKTVPSITEILSGNFSVNKIRSIDIADLLGREQVAPEGNLLQMDVTGKSILVTGAGGSIGSELCRQIASLKPSCLVLYELSEFALYSIDMELTEAYPTLHKVACLGSVNDSDRLQNMLQKYRVDTVYHAAAYKHVPLVEANSTSGILNNVFGTLTAVRCAIECQVGKFVLISTDKAVRPTNVMGATKRVAELILQALAEQPGTSTCLTMVRFGNVLGSSGSVVPRFRQQIAEGKAVTVTHPDITRYFMSITEAASLVIQAGAMATGGEVFLLDMGAPVRIYDLAEQMIRLSGLEPGKDIPIKVTGLRPGEKIYEELLIDCNKARPTRHAKIFCASEYYLHWEELSPRLETLLFHAQHNNFGGSLSELQRIVPEYKSQFPTSKLPNSSEPYSEVKSFDIDSNTTKVS